MTTRNRVLNMSAMIVLSIRGSLDGRSSSIMISRMKVGSASGIFAAGLEVTASAGAALTTGLLLSFVFPLCSLWIFASMETVSFSNALEQRMTRAARIPAASINCFGNGFFTILSFEGYKGRKRVRICNCRWRHLNARFKVANQHLQRHVEMTVVGYDQVGLVFQRFNQ
jgi:hypothetical protein